jgi:LPS-assembly protein
MRPAYSYLLRPLLAAALLVLLAKQSALANPPEPPARRFLFSEDRLRKKQSAQKKKEIQQRQREVTKKAKEAGFPYDVNATKIDYDTTERKIKGSGGVIINYSSAILEAEEVEIGLASKVASLKGDVRLTDRSGNIGADEMNLKLDDGTGFFKNGDIFFEDGHYRVLAEEVRKVGKEDFEFDNCTLTTCECADTDDTDPWRIEGKRGEITRNGYGQIKDAILYAYNLPVFYTPYSIFPVKTERQSGVLPGSFGGGQRSGFSATLPIYLVLDNSTDATLTAVYNARARIGIDSEFRKVFSDRTSLEMGGLYFNESLRGGDLLGTQLSGLADPTIDENRFAGYLNFDSLNHKVLDNDFQFIARGRYVSDDLILREYNRREIGAFNTRFVTSRAAARYSFLESFTLEAAAEFNQAMVDNDDLIFQRVPDLSLQGLHVFRPFGDNPLGAKLVLTDSVTATKFARKELFDGSRAEVYEQLALPFHYKNYFDVTLGADVRATTYALDDREFTFTRPGSSETLTGELPSSSNRLLPGASAQIGTVLEQVFPVSSGNPLKFISELGDQGRQGELTRIKHTLEPTVRYRFVPQVDQSDNPQFDSTDRLPRRNFVTYALTQRFFGRFEGRDPDIYGIEEVTPELGDLGALGSRTPIDQAFDLGAGNLSDSYSGISRGKRSELMNVSIAQTYDLDRDRRKAQLREELGPDADLNPLSDVTLRGNLMPNEYFRLTGGLSLDTDDIGFSAYDFGAQFTDKRGDQLRTRLVFTDGFSGPVRQAETSVELRLTDRFKLGFYGRYDDVKKDFLERRVGVRFNSSCRCWILDVDVWDRLNPNETRLNVTLTLVGISELGTNLFTQRPNSQFTGQ